VEEVLPCKPLRQWVLSLPFALRFLLATNPQLLTQVLGIVYRTISGDLLRAAGRTRHGRYGCSDLDPAVGSALNLNIHLHVLFLDGVYVRAAVGEGEAAKPVFQRVAAPSSAALQALVQRVAERIGSALRTSFALPTLPPRPQREHNAYVAAARGHLGRVIVRTDVQPVYVDASVREEPMMLR